MYSSNTIFRRVEQYIRYSVAGLVTKMRFENCIKSVKRRIEKHIIIGNIYSVDVTEHNIFGGTIAKFL